MKGILTRAGLVPFFYFKWICKNFLSLRKNQPKKSTKADLFCVPNGILRKCIAAMRGRHNFD